MKGLLLAAMCLASLVCAVAVYSHFARPERLARVFSAAFAFWSAVYFAAYLLTPDNLFFLSSSFRCPQVIFDLLYGYLLFGFLFHDFLCFYFGLNEGFSTSFLLALHESKEHGLSEGEIIGIFQESDGADKIIGWRVPRLIKQGYIRLDIAANAYTLTPKGLAVARLALFLKRMLNLGPGG